MGPGWGGGCIRLPALEAGSYLVEQIEIVFGQPAFIRGHGYPPEDFARARRGVYGEHIGTVRNFLGALIRLCLPSAGGLRLSSRRRLGDAGDLGGQGGLGNFDVIAIGELGN